MCLCATFFCWRFCESDKSATLKLYFYQYQFHNMYTYDMHSIYTNTHIYVYTYTCIHITHYEYIPSCIKVALPLLTNQVVVVLLGLRARENKCKYNLYTDTHTQIQFYRYTHTNIDIQYKNTNTNIVPLLSSTNQLSFCSGCVQEKQKK